VVHICETVTNKSESIFTTRKKYKKRKRVRKKLFNARDIQNTANQFRYPFHKCESCDLWKILEKELKKV
jgi:hypothetical protein